MNPLVSVVIPTYGRFEQLERAVRSVMSQQCDCIFEVVVVDDNPPDSQLSQQISSMLASRFPAIRHIANSGRRGGAGARNTGIEQARGKWIAFLDDDDEWLPGKLAAQVSKAGKVDDETACMDTGFVQVNAVSGESKTVVPKLQGAIFDDLLVKHRGRAPKLSTLMCRRDALVSVGMFDPDMPSRQDLDLYLRLARHFRFASEPKPLAIKHLHAGDRISTNHAKKLKGFELFYRKYREDFRLRPDLHRIFLRQYARRSIRSGDYIAALRLMLRSMFVSR